MVGEFGDVWPNIQIPYEKPILPAHPELWRLYKLSGKSRILLKKKQLPWQHMKTIFT